MNSAAISKITKLDFIKKLNLPPSPGDSGAAIGAAYYGFINKTNNCVSQNNIKRNLNHMELIGCSKNYLKKHLENQFVDNMNFENYDVIGIDEAQMFSGLKNYVKN